MNWTMRTPLNTTRDHDETLPDLVTLTLGPGQGHVTTWEHDEGAWHEPHLTVMTRRQLPTCTSSSIHTHQEAAEVDVRRR